MDQNLYRRRLLTNRIGIALSMAAATLGLFVLLWILFMLIQERIPSN